LWPAAIGGDIKVRATGKVICTLQARALYLEGMHPGRGRSAQITADEFRRTVGGLEASPVDGMCVFTFSQLLGARETAEGREMIASLQRFRRN
jgi:hypothetical protein